MIGEARSEIDAVGDASEARGDHVAGAEPRQFTVAMDAVAGIGLDQARAQQSVERRNDCEARRPRQQHR